MSVVGKIMFQAWLGRQGCLHMCARASLYVRWNLSRKKGQGWGLVHGAGAGAGSGAWAEVMAEAAAGTGAGAEGVAEAAAVVATGRPGWWGQPPQESSLNSYRKPLF